MNPLKQGKMLAPSIKNLKDYLSGLSPSDSLTIRHIILSSYTTWRACTLIQNSAIISRSRIPDTEKNEDDDENGDDDRKMDSDTLRLLKFTAVDLFGRIILDEKHKIKSVRTTIVQSVRLLKADHYFFLSVILMLNRFSDLGGFLSLIWQSSWTKVETSLFLSEYEAATVYLY